jgi:hypothetical protein
LTLALLIYLASLSAWRWTQRTAPIRLVGDRRQPDKDWQRLLNHEKCAYARQLERDGHVDEARTIYEHLTNDGYGHPLPYERLASLYRTSGDAATEVEVLEKAIDALTDHPDASRYTAPHRLRALSARLEELTDAK